MGHRVDTVNVNDSPMEVFMYEPDGDGPHPGIVLCQHIPVGHTGVENDEFTLVAAQRYADAGFSVAVPFIFHWWPKSEEMQVKRDEFRDDWTTLDLRTTFDHLAGQDNVDSKRIAIVGHCWGGRVSLLGACHNPDYAACAVFYGGRADVTMGPGTPPVTDLMGNINCPVFGFFGNEDENPSPELVNKYEKALTDGGVESTFYRYDGAGHAFQNFPSPEKYREEQSEDAWGKVIDHLKETLAA
ncbi:MAG: dienelactone hydrolase family protein [Rhodospirillaceae bacterium]|jgi:carboxymethylenebutenolidase|nr:dienelactone hydrolase family protein [Rhodospirillales bacterium]MBT3907825.1 dienelactone hydrolase family protein [Rhodospirillaceae bacterium]MBT4699623.1 dienelactone hydrolase family protein [Rhodospirillaceae bacterium]MBT5035740.1 dienelactone hydrolase family protein [Rhodospirillaceae bacterium]MBT6218743.1 dienelactone hydrolase family protein [Rhodospirillaceae bacterium]